MIERLLAEARRDRLNAIRELGVTPALAFALRRVLFTDRDSHVRSAAANRLATFAEAEPWLLDALGDRSPLVRDAILRALARCGTGTAAPALRALIAGDHIWWIRRAAVYALAAVAGASEVPTFTAALADPFWRVRHAAVRVLVVLGARDPDIRDEMLDVPESGTLTFLRSSWGPVAIEAPVRATSRSALPPALLDPDPAVVTARLATDADVTPLALVELLCDPHVALRTLAAERLVATRDLAAIEAALDWLEEPRIPHVVECVYSLLDDLGDPAAELAERALRSLGRHGAARWAISWIVSTRSESLYDLACERARHGDASVRAEAIAIASTDELVVWAEDATLADAIAAELHERRELEALGRLDGTRHPRIRALQVDASARRGEWELVDPSVMDPHHGPRAIAARWLVRAGRVDPERIASDPDPAVREAAVMPATAAQATHDPDPWVRRAALHVLVGAATRDGLSAAGFEAVHAALAAEDPWLRQEACRAPLVDDRLLAGVLGRLGDTHEMVRASALDALERLPESDARVRAVLAGELPAPTRVMAYSWLVRRLDDAASELARAAYEGEPDTEARTLLAGVAGITVASTSSVSEDSRAHLVAGITVASTSSLVATSSGLAERGARESIAAGSVPEDSRARLAAATRTVEASVERVERRPVERRPFGRAGFSVAPLAISGAYDLPVRSLEAAHAAGVDLYFWEPGYDILTKFLRPHARSTHVITGTYHADAASIRHDVHRALRTLRRDALDAFLLFWTRSPARVSPEAFAVLDELRREGKIRAVGFSTHHRDLARDAIAASPWDVVMIRHSAAHPGIETELLPSARASTTAIVTFSALTYGRMLSGPHAPTPAECYRYSLAQPGVTACISAPRRYRELSANLEALATPSLPAERIAELRAHGTGVRAESARFNTLLRQPTRDAAAAAREMLATEPPPTDAETARLPSAGANRRSRTRLGTPRRRQ